MRKIALVIFGLVLAVSAFATPYSTKPAKVDDGYLMYSWSDWSANKTWAWIMSEPKVYEVPYKDLGTILYNMPDNELCTLHDKGYIIVYRLNTVQVEKTKIVTIFYDGETVKGYIIFNAAYTYRRWFYDNGGTLDD